MLGESPSAVLWDMDGTLIDTEHYWIAACRDLIEDHGGDLGRREESLFVGASMQRTALLIRERGVDLGLDTIIGIVSAAVRGLMADTGIPWKPGVLELLDLLDREKIPTALVTMSFRENADVLLDLMGRSGVKIFDEIVTGDIVSRGKPHPEPYTTAVRRLGFDPYECLAIEDSQLGATSAVTAGVHTVIVPSVEKFALPNSTTWDSLAGRTISDLSAAWATRALPPAGGECKPFVADSV